MLALNPVALCAYTTLSSQEFHHKLHEGFFTVVIDVCVVPASTHTGS